jgi:chromosome segregation ATPase
MTKARTRGDVLRESRQRDSREKRAKVISTVDIMKANGDPITMLGVARAAGVSNWLVYQPEIREYIEGARSAQDKESSRRQTSGTGANAAGLAVDLRLAREEVRTVRQERDRLKEAMRRNLGQQLDQTGVGDLTARINELLAANQQLEDQISAVNAERVRLKTDLEAAVEEVATVRMAMQQVMRETNRQAK